ncbi:MAG: PD-(D/E)XK nuclease family protein [Tissierellia bacterium]|nr:PD-(D/E)XK nuclease family protein [Tissierellia bacterium]
MKVIASRNSLANRDRMFEHIKRDLKDKKRVYLIVPEQSTLSTELDIFEYFEFESTIDLKVKSFRSIVNEILLRQGGLKLNFLSEASQKLILKIAIDQVKDQIKVYAKSLNKEGFSDLVLDFIKLIKSNLLSPESLAAINEKAAYKKELKDKISDLQLIYKAYQDMVDRSAYDSHDRINLAIEKIKLMDQYRDICFYIDLFSNMSKQEIAFIKELDKLSKQVTINVTIDKELIDILDSKAPSEAVVDDGQIFEVSKRFIKSLEAMDMNFECLENDDHENVQVDLLLKKIFSYKKPDKADEDQALSKIYINRYKNTEEECEMLAVNINKDIYLNKLRFKDIAVLVTDTQEYYDKIKRQFSLNNISFFMDTHRDLLENPIAKYIKSAIALLASNFSHEYIVSYLKHAFFELDQYELNIFQNFLSQRRIVGDMIFQDRYFDYGQKKSKRKSRFEEEDKINFEISKKIRDIFLESIADFGTTFSQVAENRNKKDKIITFCKKIYAFLSLDGAINRIKEFEDKLEDLKKNDIIEENRLIWNKFIGILDDFSKIDDQYLISFEDFSSYLEEAMADIKIGIVPPSKDQVLIGDLDRSRFNKIEKLYVIGMTNLYFPKVHTSADLLIDEEKNLLIDNGIEIENTNKKYSDKDMFALYNALSKAKSEIVFTYSLVNSSNQSMENASLISNVEPLIGSGNKRLNNYDYKDYLYSKTKLSYYLPMTYRRIKNGKKITPSERKFCENLIEKIATNEKYRSISNSIQAADRYLIQESRLRPQAAKEAFPDERKLSISQIEKFVSCPYSHFISYGLRPREDSSFNMDPLSFGNIAHESLDIFIREHVRDDFKDAKDIYESMQDDMDQVISENFSQYQLEDYKNRYFIGNLKSILGISFYALKEQYVLMQPDKTYTEALYSDDKYAFFPGLKYEVDGKIYDMKGIIDRVDQYEIDGRKYFRVIDYKTGSKKFDLLRLFYGLDLQLMVYLYTVSRLENSSPLGAFYISLNHRFRSLDDLGKLQGKIMEKHMLDGLLVDDNKALLRSDASFSLDSRPNSNLVKVDSRIKDYKKQKNIISQEVFENIFDNSNRIIKESIHKIKAGDISVKPYRLENMSPCTFCPYRTICKFKNDNYRNLKTLSKDEVLEKLGVENE